MEVSPKKIDTLPNLLAGLQLDQYLVDDLIFKCNKFVMTKEDKPVDSTISVDFEVRENIQDKSKFLLELKVDLNEGQELKMFQSHQIHLHLLGWFRFTMSIDDQTKARMLATNASSILYGVARSIVADLTGSLGAERYILPSLNLMELAKAKLGSRPEVSKSPASVKRKR
jgi:preprotein translocase subunit SecB